jgi:hypothetical protein
MCRTSAWMLDEVCPVRVVHLPLVCRNKSVLLSYPPSAARAVQGDVLTLTTAGLAGG